MAREGGGELAERSSTYNPTWTRQNQKDHRTRIKPMELIKTDFCNYNTKIKIEIE